MEPVLLALLFVVVLVVGRRRRRRTTAAAAAPAAGDALPDVRVPARDTDPAPAPRWLGGLGGRR